MKAHFEKEPHFENESSFRNPLELTVLKDSLPTALLSRKTSFFFLTQPENDLSAKKDNTNGTVVIT